tara:strand:- start:399 stop:656 length:258 start_codon:yes stop_codon:yes gene_type:complete
MNICKNKNTIIEKVNNKNILLNLDNGGFFELNDIGMEIWENISENITIEDLIKKLKEKYNNEGVEKDCLEFLEKLQKRKLISYRD